MRGIAASELLISDTVETEHTAKTGMAQGRHTAIGTFKNLIAQALALITGFVTTIFLTRQFGPELYGQYSIAFTVILWAKFCTTPVFGSTTVKFVAEAADWRSTASMLAQIQLLISMGTAALLLLVAPTLASWLGTLELTAYLRLFALEIPLFALALIHRSTLVGQGAFGQGALLTAVYWVSRIILMFLLVGLGLSVPGAILANVGASAVQLVMARVFVRPVAPLSHLRVPFPVRRLVRYMLPLFLYNLGMLLFKQFDLLVVKASSETSAAAGLYSAATNLTIVPISSLAVSFTSPLLAMLTQMWRQGQHEDARFMIEQAMRFVLCLLPFAGLVAGAAPEIVDLVYGSSFSFTASLLMPLILVAVAQMMISVATTILTAADRPGWTFASTGLLAPLALGAYLILVPRFGPIGAAAARAVLAWFGAGVTMLVVYLQCSARPSPQTLLRITLTTVLAYTLSSIWQPSGAWVILELSGIAVIILACLFLLGELTGKDLAFAWSLLKREKDTAPKV